MLDKYSFMTELGGRIGAAQKHFRDSSDVFSKDRVILYIGIAVVVAAFIIGGIIMDKKKK